MVTALTLVIGHILILIGLRIFIGMYSNNSKAAMKFIASKKFKSIIVSYFVFVLCAIFLPMVWL